MAEENSYPLVPLGQIGPPTENDALSSTSAFGTDVTDEEKQSMVAAWVAASSSAFDYTLFRIRAQGGGGQPAAGATSGSWNMPSGSRRGTNGGVGTDPVSVVPFDTSVGWDTAPPPGNRRETNGSGGTTGHVPVPAASVGWNMPSGNRRGDGNTGPDPVPTGETSGSRRGTNGGGGGPVRPVPVRAVPRSVGWSTLPSCSRTNGGGASAGAVPMPAATPAGWPTPSGSRPVQVPADSATSGGWNMPSGNRTNGGGAGAVPMPAATPAGWPTPSGSRPAQVPADSATSGPWNTASGSGEANGPGPAAAAAAAAAAEATAAATAYGVGYGMTQEDETGVKCCYCNLTVYVSFIRTHVEVSHPEKLLGCRFCNFSALTYHELCEHLANVHINLHRCASCPFVTDTRYKLRHHTATKHENTGPHYTCPACPFFTTNMSYMMGHIKRQHT